MSSVDVATGVSCSHEVGELVVSSNGFRSGLGLAFSGLLGGCLGFLSGLARALLGSNGTSFFFRGFAKGCTKIIKSYNCASGVLH